MGAGVTMIALALLANGPEGPRRRHALRECLAALGVGVRVVRAGAACDLELALAASDEVGAALDAAARCFDGSIEQPAARDAWGVPCGWTPPRGGHDALAGADAVYTVERWLRRVLPRALDERSPRWPGGADYAVGLSHDVDLPERHPPARMALARARLFAQRRDPLNAGRALAGAGRSLLAHAFGLSPVPERDSQFAFDGWRHAEETLGARSAFYISVTPVTEPGADPRDVPYDASGRHFRNALARAADAGWEIALHASIGASRVPGRLVVERERLRALVPNADIAGVRHHFWNLPGDAPLTGWREQLLAGFSYDSSLGLNDAAGPRWGWPWPFRPWDPASAREVPLLQVPPTTMDAVYGDGARPAEAREALLFTHLDSVRRAGGVVVPDWHLEQLDAARLHGVRDVLFGALRRLQVEAGNGWWTTPREIAQWWSARRDALWQD